MVGGPPSLEQSQSASRAALVAFFYFSKASGAGGTVCIQVHHRILGGQLGGVHVLALVVIKKRSGALCVGARDREPESGASASWVTARWPHKLGPESIALQQGAGSVETGQEALGNDD
jgi:hypothetical protein